MPAAIQAPTCAEFAMVVIVAADLTLAGSGRFMNTMSLQEEPGVRSKQFEGSPVTLNTARLAARRTVPPGRIEALPGHHLYQNRHVLPRFFPVGETQAVGSL
jgi:hypothetical protein